MTSAAVATPGHGHNQPYFEPMDAQRQPPSALASARIYSPSSNPHPRAFASPIDRVRDTESPVARWVAATSPFRSTPSPSHQVPSQAPVPASALPTPVSVPPQPSPPPAPSGSSQAVERGTWLGSLLSRNSSATAPQPAPPPEMAQVTPLELPPTSPPRARARSPPVVPAESPIARWVQDTRRAQTLQGSYPNPRIVDYKTPSGTLERARSGAAHLRS